MTLPCPHCRHPIRVPLATGHVRAGHVEIRADTRGYQLHIRYCAKNPEATPI